MSNQKYFPKCGDIYNIRNNCTATIIKIFNHKNIIIKTSNGIEKRVQYIHLREGRVLCPLSRTVYEIGITNGLETSYMPSFYPWREMIRRCYGNKKPVYNAYTNAIVCDEWHKLENFDKWHKENYTEGWVLDKDIKNPGIKIYSPKNCMYIPVKINSMFTNIYSNKKILGYRFKCKQDYWNNKYEEVKLLELKYPFLKGNLFKCFEYVFNKKY